MKISNPDSFEYGSFYKNYIEKAGDDPVSLLQKQITSTADILKNVSEEDSNKAYAEGKWTIKELIGHLSDAERIFGYRLLRISRGDSTPLSGFEENEYVKNADFGKRTLTDLLSELEAVRKANFLMISSLSEKQHTITGIANDNPISVRALIYILAGHALHHEQILQERYLNK